MVPWVVKNATRPIKATKKTAMVKSESPVSWRIVAMDLPRVTPRRPMAEKMIQVMIITNRPREFLTKVDSKKENIMIISNKYQ